MKKYIISFCISLLFISIWSCQDIDLSPKDNIRDDRFWETPADFIKEVNTLYSRTETFGTKDTDSDIAFELQENSISNGTHSAPNKDDLWNDTYLDLRQSNTILEKGAIYKRDTAEIGRYVAEARFFRAYSHWRLMKKFNDIPILTKSLHIDSEELYSKREPQARVEDFILSELDAIIDKLPKQSELKSSELGRITQGATLALKARVALFAGTWAKYHKHRDDYQQLLEQAISASNRVIDSKEYSLFEKTGDDSYRRLFIDDGDDNSESIFASRYYKNIRMHSTAHSVYWGWRGTPTKKLADMYLCKSTGLPIDKANSGFQGFATIADEFKNRDPRMSQTILIPNTPYINAQIGKDTCSAKFTTRPETRTGYKLWKFMGEAQGGGTNDSYYDFHIIRYPEVLLILAEATFEKDGIISNETLDKTINVIRSRKGVEMPALTNEFVQTNGLDMQTEIRRERTVELSLEGFRRDDLRRWKTAETELKKAIRGIKYKGTEYEALKVLNSGNAGVVDADGFLIIIAEEKRFFTAPKHYYYSLPLDEVFLNPNLLPNNPGW